jgi:hypothetical protein
MAGEVESKEWPLQIKNLPLFSPSTFLLSYLTYIGGSFVKRKWLIIVSIPFILLLFFALTFIPHKLIKIDDEVVSKIVVFDGNTGYETEITNSEAITHIINNLNEITFQKGKPSWGYMGYSFDTTILDQDGVVMKEFIINSNDTIRYKGFFYKDKTKSIDYEYIEELVRN